ncbi:MAG: hypothetical protein ACFNVH_00700 [Segatella maculosa]
MARKIQTTMEVKRTLIKAFGVTERMVNRALSFNSDSELARKIRHTARMKGGWIEASVPEEEIFYDITENGERLLRQYFENGAVLEANMTKGMIVVSYKGQPKKEYDDVLLTEIPATQEYARAL